jgi:hypothetical protein
MPQQTKSTFKARIEELRRDWPLLIADQDIGQWLQHELGDEAFEDVFRDFIGSARSE